MPIKLNSLEQNAETQIFRRKLPIDQYAVGFRITTNQYRVLITNKPKHSRTDCRNSNIQTKIANKPICSVPPNNKNKTLL